MELQIISEEKKPLLGRKEIKARVTYQDKTPARKSIRSALAKKLSAEEKLIAVRKIMPEYGVQAAKIEAVIYENEKIMKELEPKHIIERHTGKQEKTEQPAEQDKAEEKEKTEKPKEQEKTEEKKE